MLFIVCYQLVGSTVVNLDYSLLAACGVKLL
jgi:hypothetical protein